MRIGGDVTSTCADLIALQRQPSQFVSHIPPVTGQSQPVHCSGLASAYQTFALISIFTEFYTFHMAGLLRLRNLHVVATCDVELPPDLYIDHTIPL